MDWTVIIFILTLIFNGGVMYKTFKDKPSETRVNELIDVKFANHCPFIERIGSLERVSKEDSKYKEKLARELLKENEATHMALQRIEINLIAVCKKIGLDYIQVK